RAVTASDGARKAACHEVGSTSVVARLSSGAAGESSGVAGESSGGVVGAVPHLGENVGDIRVAQAVEEDLENIGVTQAVEEDLGDIGVAQTIDFGEDLGDAGGMRELELELELDGDVDDRDVAEAKADAERVVEVMMKPRSLLLLRSSWL
ncbi:hypothetical protein Dimus_001218, partial [Dionaea muscipula]